MFKLITVILLGLFILSTTAAPVVVTNQTCSIQFNDYTLPTGYQICTPNSPPDPSGMRLGQIEPEFAGRSLMATPPSDYNPISCSKDMDSGLCGGVITVGKGSSNYTVCYTYNCARNADCSNVITWLNKYPYNAAETTPCFSSGGKYYLDIDGACSYQGSYNIDTQSCSCHDGYGGDTCTVSTIKASGNSLLPSFILIVFVLGATLFSLLH